MGLELEMGNWVEVEVGVMRMEDGIGDGLWLSSKVRFTGDRVGLNLEGMLKRDRYGVELGVEIWKGVGDGNEYGLEIEK